jgi:hypothetical protein
LFARSAHRIDVGAVLVVSVAPKQLPHVAHHGLADSSPVEVAVAGGDVDDQFVAGKGACELIGSDVAEFRGAAPA